MAKLSKTVKIIACALLVLGIFIIYQNMKPFIYQQETAKKTTTESSKKTNDNTDQVNNIDNAAKQVVSEKELYDVRPEIGETFGELTIPKIEATLPIIEGTDEDELEKGVGHYRDSVLPGEADNAVLSGHRDTVFRRLGEVGEGDFLIVKTSAGTFTYKVYKVRIVDADDRTVIVPTRKATLTVTTCYPFYYIGDAPQRYILSAYLTKSELAIDN